MPYFYTYSQIVLWLTQSGLSLLHRYGTSLTCISMPFRLTMTTAPSTDCYKNGSKVRFQPVLSLYLGGGWGCFTFGSGSSRNPMAKVTIITMTADSKPAIWKGQRRYSVFSYTDEDHFFGVTYCTILSEQCCWTHASIDTMNPGWEQWTTLHW